jgi:hypothetical protein
MKGSFTSAGAAQGTAIMTIFSDQACHIGCNGNTVDVWWTATAGAPAIASQPEDRTTVVGGTATFGVDATGTPAPNYQWQISTNGGASYTDLANAPPYSGVTSQNLTITGATLGLNGARYRAVVSNGAGSATSDGGVLNVTAAELVQNGSFNSGLTGWTLFATPDTSYIVWEIVGGVFQYYRQPPPPGTSNQAVIFQQTGVSVGTHAALAAQFDLGNSDSVRKRISVLMIDSDFSDLAVCTFWLPPGAPLQTHEAVVERGDLFLRGLGGQLGRPVSARQRVGTAGAGRCDHAHRLRGSARAGGAGRRAQLRPAEQRQLRRGHGKLESVRPDRASDRQRRVRVRAASGHACRRRLPTHGRTRVHGRDPGSAVRPWQ